MSFQSQTTKIIPSSVLLYLCILKPLISNSSNLICICTFKLFKSSPLSTQLCIYNLKLLNLGPFQLKCVFPTSNHLNHTLFNSSVHLHPQTTQIKFFSFVCVFPASNHSNHTFFSFNVPFGPQTIQITFNTLKNVQLH